MLAYLRELNIVSMMLRIFLAMFLGGIIGLEREKKNRPAGFRTYMIVALGASLTMILSQYLNLMLNTEWAETAAEVGIRTDVSRFGAQVINGVGFLGAGTILVTTRKKVKGVTTAAGLWASACMGIAAGAGFYECVIISFVLVFFVFSMLPLVESFINTRSRNVDYYIEIESMDAIGQIINTLKSKEIKIYDLDLEKLTEPGKKGASANISLRLPSKVQHTDVLASLASLNGVTVIEEI